MAKTKTAFDAPFHKGEKVTATTGLPGVPEGTEGRVKVVNGMTWKRYWVFFDNGVDLGSIDHAVLVRAKQWPQYQLHREEAAATAEQSLASAAPAAGGDDAPAAAAGGAASRVPEHLLERTRARKQALGIG